MAMTTYPIYIVSIRVLDASAPPLLQDLEMFKSFICPDFEMGTLLERETELEARVEYIKNLVLGGITVDMSGVPNEAL